MAAEEKASDIARQPVRGEPVSGRRPPLDWGDEEPNPVWEKLYYKGSVDPPYRSGRDRRELVASIIADWKPLGKPMTNEELMCALGRCRCERCE